MKRRDFIRGSTLVLAAAEMAAAQSQSRLSQATNRSYRPGRIPNEYSLLLPGELEALRLTPTVSHFEPRSVRATLGRQTLTMSPGDSIDGWYLVTVVPRMNGTATAIFEKHVTHRGAIAYVTEDGGTIAYVPKGIGDLAKIRPRPVNTPGAIKLDRPSHYVPHPDAAGNYILDSSEDPCYENVAALGKEYVGWSLVANEDVGPAHSLFIEPDGRSRQIPALPDGQSHWAPDLAGRIFDPKSLLLQEEPQIYEYVDGYSKRTLLGGYLPVADTGVWNPVHQAGYEVMVVLPLGANPRPMARVRSLVPKWAESSIPANAVVFRMPDGTLYVDRYWNSTAASFYMAIAGVWNYWHDFFESRMKVEIPDPWLLDAARAGIVLSRCSYRGLNPTYQIGEGAYTKIPESSHALFPVAHYEFVWAHQLWNLSREVDPYFEHYLENYILPNGNFLYNTQDQVEAPLNTGVFLTNSARAYDYTGDLQALQRRLPVLRRMIDYVLGRYEYSKTTFPSNDRRYGLIWGSPEADLGDPRNDAPSSHPYYYQNAVWTWRGLAEHGRSLAKAGADHNLPALTDESRMPLAIAGEMLQNIRRSLASTLAIADPAMREAGITPFTPNDIHHNPTELSSYENHRFMMDWFTADWGDPALDLGHLKHRLLAGEQIIGLHTDGASTRTSNFMAHGTLSVRIRQEDYRPFLLTLYALVCYAADSGNRYSPEDAYIPGSYAGEGNPYGWSAVVNSVLQPSMGLRWLLCYEENHRAVCHLQKAAPKHWFTAGQKITVERCPTRFGILSWTTEAISDREWDVQVAFASNFQADLVIHIHPPDTRPLTSATTGTVEGMAITLPAAQLSSQRTLRLRVR